MMFRGRALLRTPGVYARIAERLGCEEAAVRAVVEVEAAGRGFLASGRPKILFERHWFSRLTKGKYDAAAPGISSPKAGGYRGNEREYDRLAEAMDLDAQAALLATSFGLGQIMGFNHVKAGYASPGAMVDAFCDSEDAQLDGMASFIAAEGLADELKRRDWAGFARRYNGSAYARNEYDKKLAAAYERAKPPDWVNDPPIPTNRPA